MRFFLRIVAFIALIVGITFLFWGLSMTDTFANRFMKEMAGEYLDETKRYIFGGIILIAISSGYLLFSFFRKKTIILYSFNNSYPSDTLFSEKL